MLATCWMAWRRGDEDIDAEAGAFVAADIAIAVLNTLTKK